MVLKTTLCGLKTGSNSITSAKRQSIEAKKSKRTKLWEEVRCPEVKLVMSRSANNYQSPPYWVTRHLHTRPSHIYNSIESLFGSPHHTLVVLPSDWAVNN